MSKQPVLKSPKSESFFYAFDITYEREETGPSKQSELYESRPEAPNTWKLEKPAAAAASAVCHNMVETGWAHLFVIRNNKIKSDGKKSLQVESCV
jgi:hypothetical protein